MRIIIRMFYTVCFVERANEFAHFPFPIIEHESESTSYMVIERKRGVEACRE